MPAQSMELFESYSSTLLVGPQRIMQEVLRWRDNGGELLFRIARSNEPDEPRIGDVKYMKLVVNPETHEDVDRFLFHQITNRLLLEVKGCSLVSGSISSPGNKLTRSRLFIINI